MAKAMKKKQGSLHRIRQMHARARKKAREIIDAPWAIKAISIVSYIAAATFILAGVGLFIGGLILEEQAQLVNSFLQVLIADPNTQLSQISPIAKAAISSILTYSGPVLIALGLVFFFIGIFRIFVGFSLLHGKAWSRVVVVCFCIIWIGFAFYSIPKGSVLPNIMTIAFNILVLYYLIFSREAHNFFHHIPNHHLYHLAKEDKNSSQKKLTHFING